MNEKTERPFGGWKSPVTSKDLSEAALKLNDVAIDGEDVIWLEGRPMQAGRAVLVAANAHGRRRDLTPAGFNVRSRVHEYGGGAFAILKGRIWFVNDADQRIYTHLEGESPKVVTKQAPGMRFADLRPDPSHERLICIRETHTQGAVENDLVAVCFETGNIRVLAQGHDFFAAPSISADGTKIAWLTWDHPDMPWDRTQIWIAKILADGCLTDVCTVATEKPVAAFQPLFGPDGRLYVVADLDDYWLPCVVRENGLEALLEMPAEFGLPQWVFGMSTFGFAGNGDLIAAFCREGQWSLGRINPSGGSPRLFDLDYSDISAVRVAGERVVFLGAGPRAPACVVSLDGSSNALTVVQSSLSLRYPETYLSVAEVLSFPTAAGARAHGFFYPPASGEFVGPPGDKPPLIVISHGGPTGASTPVYKAGIQYWTTRGFAVLDVNYRGSTGYGRRYRESLYGEWGEADVEDCVAGAHFLADTGRVDPARLAIRGSSAGGYTALAAITFHDTFACAASYYGISELSTLATDTHKFESRYLDKLIGPYPQAKPKYDARSPLYHVDRLSCPTIFFQGLEDKVVPVSQADRLVDALRKKGVAVAYLQFEGEQHGFRKAETIRRTLDAEWYFYGKIFGFTPAADIAPVEIDNQPPQLSPAGCQFDGRRRPGGAAK